MSLRLADALPILRPRLALASRSSPAAAATLAPLAVVASLSVPAPRE